MQHSDIAYNVYTHMHMVSDYPDGAADRANRPQEIALLKRRLSDVSLSAEEYSRLYKRLMILLSLRSS